MIFGQEKARENKGFLGFYQILFLAVILTGISCFFHASDAHPETIRSRSAIVVDASTGKTLYAKKPNLKLRPASTVKLMTAIVALEHAQLTDIATVSKRAVRVSPSKVGLKAGDKVTIETLLYAALVKSGNDAATVLAEAVAGSEKRFVRLMNRKACAIGATNTKFKNPHGLPAKGQYTTASDLSKIMTHALTYPMLRDIIGTRVINLLTENGHTIFLKNTNKLLWSEDSLIGGKTGYTRKARHCFVGAAKRGQSKVIVAVLGSPNRKTLWKESGKLIHEGFEVMTSGKNPFKFFEKSKDDLIAVSYKKNAKAQAKTSKVDRERNIVTKKAARDRKPKIERKYIEKVKNNKDKKEKHYKIAEKRTIDNKG